MAVNLKKGNTLASLSITPLIDVVFLLLTFFLVATRFDEEDRALDIQLPEAVQATPIWSAPRSLIININKQGEYFVSGQNVSLDQLRPLLEATCKNNNDDENAENTKNEMEEPTVIIRGDERTALGAVVAVADLCQALELKYSTVTREKE